MTTKEDFKIKNVVVAASDHKQEEEIDHHEKQEVNKKNVAADVASDNEKADEKQAANKNVAVNVASDNEKADEKQAANKNVAVNVASDNEKADVKQAANKNVAVVASDNRKADEKQAANKNVAVVASDNSHRIIITKEKKEDEKESTEVDLGINLSMDKLSLGPKKKLLVIPLGGFIVHRAHRRRPNTIPSNRRPDFSAGNFLIYKRPFCEGFLKFCFERFEVGLWSSAMEHNIDDVLTYVLGDLKSKLLFTWDQNQCTDTGYMCVDNKKKPLFLKELERIWCKKWRGGEYSSSNTLLIVDPVKALLNPPNTGIFPKEYDPKNKEDDFLGPGGEFRAFLDGLAEAKDVPTYVKDHPIGESAITSSHSDWEYYSKIIRSCGKKETRTKS